MQAGCLRSQVCAVAVVLALILPSIGSANQNRTGTSSISELQRLFQNPPDDSRVMMRWWWFGPTVTKAEIEREMRLMKEGGIGGFEVQPVYPVVLDDEQAGLKTLPYLSDGFLDALRFTADKARELGLRFDLTLGSGWPFGGPSVSINDAAGHLRVEHIKIASGARRVPVPAIGVGEKLLGAFTARVQGKGIDTNSLREITNIRDGAAWLPENSDGQSEAQFYISSHSGMQVKRPAMGGEGFVLDHLSRPATDNYLKSVGDRLIQGLGDRRPYAIFCDSLESYGNDWTSDFLEEFQKRRGYDLKPYLPAIVTDIGPKTFAIRDDYGRTLTELLNERFIRPLHEWSQKNKVLFRIQDYGSPAAVLSSNAFADLPEGEGAQWKTLSAVRWASSASHIYGHPVTSSETWTWLHSPTFRATPLDMKAEADLHFLQGINQFIGHGWPYTAPGVEYPGWRFYAAAVFDEKNPWWIVMPDVTRYLQRVSFLLRQGQPANDVAIYLPNDDAWAQYKPGNVNTFEGLRNLIGQNLLPRVLEAGYNVDFFDDEILKSTGSVENGKLRLNANRYKVVILSAVERIPLQTLQKLEEFVNSGGILIATKRTPSVSPGFRASESDNQKIVELSRRLFEGSNAKAHFVSDENEQLTEKLRSIARPDMTLSPAVPDIGFIHRHTDDAEIYFVANTGPSPRKTMATFRVDGMTAQWWDPMTGGVIPAATGSGKAGAIVALDLEPYGSRVLVFSHQAPQTVAQSMTEAAPIDLSTGWQITFGDGSKSNIDNLRSWTDEENTKYFSGTATYEKKITLGQNLVTRGTRVFLDFGEGSVEPPPNPRGNGMRALLSGPIREAAVITVNGQRAGSVWCPPYSIDITPFVKSGNNDLKIVVANTAVNYMAGHALPDYKLLNLRYGERFQPQDMDKVQPTSSGLMGPIRLIPMTVQ